MKEAMTLDDLGHGLDTLDLENILAAYDVEPVHIRSALDTGDVDKAKAAIRDILSALQTVSFGGFPIGDETDLADLVGFS